MTTASDQWHRTLFSTYYYGHIPPTSVLFLPDCLASCASVCLPVFLHVYYTGCKHIYYTHAHRGGDLGGLGGRSPQNLRWGDGPCIDPQKYLEKQCCWMGAKE